MNPLKIEELVLNLFALYRARQSFTIHSSMYLVSKTLRSIGIPLNRWSSLLQTPFFTVQGIDHDQSDSLFIAKNFKRSFVSNIGKNLQTLDTLPFIAIEINPIILPDRIGKTYFKLESTILPTATRLLSKTPSSCITVY